MTHPLTPHEKVRQIVDCALNSAIPEPWEVANHATDAIITALASGPGDHAELAAKAERCTTGDPWYKDEDLRGRQSFGQFLSQDRAFIAAANPATVLALLAENAALRETNTEAERKLAEAESRLDRWEPKLSAPSVSCGMARILAKQAADPSRRLNPLPPAPGAEA